MHAALLTVLIAAGTGQTGSEIMVRQTVYATQGLQEGCQSCAAGEPCGECGPKSCWWSNWWGPMPQTCYEPHFGCYPGNSRTIHRHPAFHGSYYRKPYNYRHQFEYPWHLAPHEPQRFNSYAQTVGDEMVPSAEPGLLIPTPAAPTVVE